MSQTLNFYADGKIVTITYLRSVSRARLNIKIGPTSDNKTTYELDIMDSDYTFTHFLTFKDFFQHLKKMKKKNQIDIVKLRGLDTLIFPIFGQSGEIEEEEMIELNRVQEVTQKELEEVQKRVDFYNNFKSKMIHKIQKIVHGHYKKENTLETTEAKEEKRIRRKQPQKKNKGPNSQSEFAFSLSTEGYLFIQKRYSNQYTLDKRIPVRDFVRDIPSLELNEFKILVKSFKYDKIYVGVQCLRGEEKEGKVRRICQFGRSLCCTFSVEEGQSLGVSAQEGGIVIRNAHNNNGKMFDNMYDQNEQNWKCKISVSLLEL